MQHSYTFNYIKIFLWQSIAIVFNFISMLIVTPRLSESPAIFGIYSFCIATSIFLTYADLGFLQAGHKYMSESFAKKDLEEEVNIVGFVSFILFIFVLLNFVLMGILALNPGIIIKNLHNEQEIKIASSLVWILAFFSPVVILQRFAQLVYGARVESFIYQRILIVSSVIRILSVYYFFTPAKYDLVGFFLFSQIINFIANLVIGLLGIKRYKYSIKLLLSSFRFNMRIFRKTRKLAFVSIYSTAIWILFFEIDLIVIAKLFGPEQVAFYSLGIILFSVFRSMYGMLYSPFTARFNHFIGQKAVGELRAFYLNVIVLTMPLIIFPILSLLLLMKPFMYSWVGEHYSVSILLSQLIVGGYIYSFISYPTSMLISALEKVKLIYITSSSLFIIFWAGVILTFTSLGIVSFALFKFIAFSVCGILYCFISFKYLKINLTNFIKKIFLPILPSCAFMILSLLYLNRFMPTDKNKLNVIIIIITGAIDSLVAIYLYYVCSEEFRSYTNQFLRKVLYFKRYQVTADLSMNSQTPDHVI